MKKKQTYNKGFTLLETLLAVAIIAAIALPLLTVFLQSVKTQQAAKGVLNANYISQDYIESLDTQLYAAALQDQPARALRNGYYLTAKILPYGTKAASYTDACDFAHLVFYDTGSVLAVMPDGKWHMFTSVPASVSLSASGGAYAFSAGSVSLSGSMAKTRCTVIVDAMKKPTGTACAITLDANCNAVRYCPECDANDIKFTGASESYFDMVPGDTSLVHIRTAVYETAAAVKPVAESESYISIRNWTP